MQKLKQFKENTKPDMAINTGPHPRGSSSPLVWPIADSTLASPQANMVDELLECIIHLANFHGISVSKRALTDDVAIAGEKITPASLPALVNKIGLSSRKITKKNNNFKNLITPFIVLTSTRGAWVVHKVTSDSVIAFIPGHEDLVQVTKAAYEKKLDEHIFEILPTDLSEHTSIFSSKTDGRKWFWKVIGEIRGEYLKVILASVIVNLLAIAAPLFTLNVYDRVLPNSAFSTLWVLAIGMGCVLVFDLLFRALRAAIIDSSGRWADVKLASNIFNHVLRIKMADKPLRSGEFANRLRDFETVREFFSSATIIAIIDILFIALFLFVIHAVGGPLAYIPAIAVVVVLLFGIIIQPLMMRNVRAVQEEAAEKHGLLIEAIHGLDTIKTLNAEKVFLKRWQALVAKTARSTEKVRGFSINMINVTIMVQQAVTVGLIIVGTYLFDAGEISMGGIIATVMLASRAVAPLGSVAGTLSRLQQSLISLKNLNDIMALEVENSEASYEVSRKVAHGTIVFDKVNFAYPNTMTLALTDTSFQIREGERIGIIGKVGAGKSTLAQLIAGLYKPAEGSVSIDGININQIHTSDLRDALGYVQQDVLLFSGTVRENIAFGQPFATDEDIVKAAELSGAASFINAHPLGYGMPVGEGGRFLSGGQRQFIALSRALIRNPTIYLLDEPTSAMDTMSEKIFMERLDEVTKGKTLIISTHRQSLLSIVDKIMFIENGRLLAYGPKAQVMTFLNKQTQSNSKAKPSFKKSGDLRPIKTKANVASPSIDKEAS